MNTTIELKMHPEKEFRNLYMDNTMKLRDELILQVNGDLKANTVKGWIKQYPAEFYHFIQKAGIILTLAGQRLLLKLALPFLD